MRRRNCSGNQDRNRKLPDLPSGNSETGGSNYFSVVSSKIENATHIFLNIAHKIGSCIENRANCIGKKVKKSTSRYLRLYKLEGRKFVKIVKFHYQDAIGEIKAPFEKIHEEYDIIKYRLLVELENGFPAGLKLLKNICQNGYKNNREMICRFMNYVYPVVGVVILCGTIGYVSSINYGLNVKCSGKCVGLVNDEYVFSKARNNMHSRINYEENQKPLKADPQYTLVVLNRKDSLNSSTQVADRLLKSSDKVLCETIGLYVDGAFMGATKDSDGLQKILSDVKSPYKDQYPNDEVSFVQDVKLEKGYYLASSLYKLEEIENKVRSSITEPIMYTVQKGDAPLSIANKHSVPYDQIKSLNPGIEKDLKPGHEILVSKSKPFLEVKVVQKCTVQDEIPFEVSQTVNKKYKSGYSKVVQEGKNGLKETTYKVTLIDGVESDRKVLGEKIISKPIDHKLIVGIKSGLQSYSDTNEDISSDNVIVGSGRLLWPVDGGHISCGMNGYRGHTGVDIAASSGTTVRAAADGVVIRSEYRGAYGNHIIIKHDNGLVTLYAHNSSNHVISGQRVVAGQKIASVGRTGNASGPHSHFEVRVNGKPVNPAKYICN